MILIASGAYLQDEFVNEVGLLPPSFLPIGNKRLYEYQIELLKEANLKNLKIYISIPFSYELSGFDESRLLELGVQVLKVPDGLSLGNSILYCWNASAEHHSALTLLHGDTLFLNGNYGHRDAISVHPNKGFYKRAKFGRTATALEQVHDEWSNDCDQVISGFFSFSEPLLFMKSLVESNSDFVQAIVNYHSQVPLSLVSGGEWLDFGHINSFYHSRTRMTTQRVFNDLKITSRFVQKGSADNPNKIYAEGFWFQNLPSPLRLYTPALLDFSSGGDEQSQPSYKLEYLYLLPLSDLLVFSEINSVSWDTIFEAISEMLLEFSSFKLVDATIEQINLVNSLYMDKTITRLEEYQEKSKVDINQKKFLINNRKYSLRDIAESSAEYISPAQKSELVISHGDLCFSNILWDSRVESVKCVDPRGVLGDGHFSIYGDPRYDIAKLFHSVIGGYDLIIADRFKVESVNGQPYIEFDHKKDLINSIEHSFRSKIIMGLGVNEREILAINVQLFLSMLPLHSDRPDRQEAFIANALRLYTRLESNCL